MQESYEPTTRFHAWMPTRELCALLAENHLVNTDLRSTLLCADWELLGGGRPFGGTGFAQLLRSSYELADHLSMEPLAELRQQLAQPFQWRSSPEIVPLDALAGWSMEDEGPAPPGRHRTTVSGKTYPCPLCEPRGVCVGSTYRAKRWRGKSRSAYGAHERCAALSFQKSRRAGIRRACRADNRSLDRAWRH